MKSGKPFSCNLIKQESGAYKLMKWKNPNFEDLRDPVRSYSFGDIEVFQPTLISLRRINKSLSSTIKSSCGSVRFGFVSQDWVFWFLTQMRENSIVHLIVNKGKFSNGYAVNQGNFGPSCVNFSQHPNYARRCIGTYLDNEKNFFFA